MFNPRPLLFLAMLITLATTQGCVAEFKYAPPDKLVAPEPIQGNTGKFKSPYTSDGVVAEWVDSAYNAGKTGENFGGIFSIIPFLSSLVAYSSTSLHMAVAGGEELINKTSDLSFNSIDDMSLYLYVKHSSHPSYGKVLQAVQTAYSEFFDSYHNAIVEASKGVL